MNSVLAALIALIISTQHVTPLNAKYMAREQLGLDRHHTPATATCEAPPATNNPPALWYYMDGDTPATTAYSDYVADYEDYFTYYPHVCHPAPEADPHDDYAFLFEDGSYVGLDGSTGCLANWPCDD